MVKLGDVLFYEQPNKYIIKDETKNKQKSNIYNTPVLTAGDSLLLGYTSEQNNIYQASKENPVIIFDDFMCSFHWIDFPFKVKSSALKILKLKNGNNISLFRYVYYMMKKIGISYKSTEHKRHWISIYANIEIPLPSLEEQKRIVGQLNYFTSILDTLKSLFHLSTSQYEYYRNQFLNYSMGGGQNKHIIQLLTNLGYQQLAQELKDLGVKEVKLGEICKLSRGEVISKEYIKENPGDYPVYSSQTLNEGEMGKIDSYQYDGEEDFIQIIPVFDLFDTSSNNMHDEIFEKIKAFYEKYHDIASSDFEDFYANY